MTLNYVNLAVAVRAGIPWRAEVEVPDVLGFRDVLWDPDGAKLVISERLAAGLPQGRPRRFEYPKPSGAAYRQMLCLDPFADLVYRLAVGRVVPHIERALGDEVVRTRCTGSGVSWRTEGWRGARERRTQQVAEGRQVWPDGFEVTTDIKDFYPSIHLGHLQRLLHSVGCPDGGVQRLIEMVDGFRKVPGMPQGLPIGPEASAPLGTLALLHLDRCLTRMGIPFARWVDDIHFWAPNSDSADEAIEAIEASSALSHQQLNTLKTLISPLADGSPLFPSVDPWLSGVEEFGDEPGDAVNESWVEALLTDPAQAVDVPRWLGQLRHHQKPTAIATLLENPWIIHRFPKQVARYLDAVAHHVPWGKVVEMVLDSAPDQETAAGLLHLARVMPPKAISGPASLALVDKAMTLDARRFSPLRDVLLLASATSDEKANRRHNRSLELLDVVGDLNARRALLAGFRVGGVSQSARKELARQAQLDPELAPTVRWALAA